MLLLALLAGLFQAPADTIHLVLVATTDVHGEVTGWDDLQETVGPGGLARAATVLDSLRARYPGQVLLVDAGDALQGSPLASYFGRLAPRDLHPVVDAMNSLGYDAATPGDRDFEFGLTLFDRALSGAAFPWVSANLFSLPGDTLLLRPFAVVIRNGVRVAITGFTTPATMVRNRDYLRDRLRAGRIEPLVEPLLRSMRHEADLVIVLSHSGLDGLPSYDTTGIGTEDAAARFATGRTRPDIVVVGHSHADITDSVLGGVHFVQPRAWGRGLAVLQIALAAEQGRLVPVRIRATQISLDEVPVSPRIERRLAEAHAAVKNWLATKIGEAETALPLAAARVEDVPLVRFVHEVQRRASGAALSLTSVFDLRAGFTPGEITIRSVFRLYPQDYTLRAIRLSGADLKAWLERSARYFYVDSTGFVATNRYVPPANFDLLGGARYTIDLSAPPGARVTRLEVAGRPVESGDSFTVALADYRQQGGGAFPGAISAPVTFTSCDLVRDLLVADIQRRRVLQDTDFGSPNWILAPPELAARARAVFVRPLAAVPAAADSLLPLLDLPRPPSASELRARDSLERAQSRTDSIAHVALATLHLPAEPGRGGTLARLLADAYRNELQVDLAVVSLDGAGARIAAGPMTASAAAAAMAGEPGLVRLTMSGSAVILLGEHLVADTAGCCEISGAAITFDPRAKQYDRVRSLVLVAGGKPDPRRQYTVVFSGLLVEGDSLLPLAATDCQPGRSCRRPGRLSDLGATPVDAAPVALLRGYLQRLPQPVSPPDRPRLVPTH